MSFEKRRGGQPEKRLRKSVGLARMLCRLSTSARTDLQPARRCSRWANVLNRTRRMPAYQAPFLCFVEDPLAPEKGGAEPTLQLRPCLDNEMIECAAQALFKFVFARSERLDVKHVWINCDEARREGFLSEAKAALEAVWSSLRLRKDHELDDSVGAV